MVHLKGEGEEEDGSAMKLTRAQVKAEGEGTGTAWNSGEGTCQVCFIVAELRMMMLERPG